MAYRYEADWIASSKVGDFPKEIYKLQPTGLSADSTVKVEDVIPGTPEREINFNPYVLVDTIHDGRVFPEHISDALIEDNDLRRKADESFVIERDWGAGLIADAVARHLQLTGFYEVQSARNVLDFGRFPGISRPWSAHLDRLSVSGPLAPYIRRNCPSEVLGYYTGVGNGMEKVINEKLDVSERARPSDHPTERIRLSRFIRIAIHTFDEYDRDNLRRPKVGIIHRSRSIAKQGHLPDGVFSRHFPDQLAAFSADRLLKGCLSCAFEKNYIPEVSDWPYTLPEGGVELRIQAWLWLQHLRAVFEDQDPGRFRTLLRGIDEQHYEDYWKAALNLNSVHPTSRLINPFLEGQMKDDHDLPVNLMAARKTDQAVTTFLEDAEANSAGVPYVVLNYQYDAFRPSCIVIEVRKNEIFGNGWDKGREPGKAPNIKDINTEFVEKVGRSVKEGLIMYWLWQEQKKTDERV